MRALSQKASTCSLGCYVRKKVEDAHVVVVVVVVTVVTVFVAQVRYKGERSSSGQ